MTADDPTYTPPLAEMRGAYIEAQADLIPGFSGYDEERAELGAEFDRGIAALASTPSPAQPTEASERAAREAAWWEGEEAGRENQGHIIAGTGIAVTNPYVLPVAELSPSPVQGADDRPWENPWNASVLNLDDAEHRATEQAALNEVREYGLRNPDTGEVYIVTTNREHVERQWRRGHPSIEFVERRAAGEWSAAELRAAPQAGDDRD